MPRRPVDGSANSLACRWSMLHSKTGDLRLTSGSIWCMRQPRGNGSTRRAAISTPLTRCDAAGISPCGQPGTRFPGPSTLLHRDPADLRPDWRGPSLLAAARTDTRTANRARNGSVWPFRVNSAASLPMVVSLRRRSLYRLAEHIFRPHRDGAIQTEASLPQDPIPPPAAARRTAHPPLGGDTYRRATASISLGYPKTNSGWNLVAIRRIPSCQSTVVPPISSCMRVTSHGTPPRAWSDSSNTGVTPTSEPR